MGLHDLTVFHLYEGKATTHPNQAALLGAEAPLSFRELFQSMESLASGLKGAGLAKGDRVCLLAQNSYQHFQILGACSRIGLVLAPINWRLSPEEIGEVFQLLEPQAVIVGANHLSQVQALDPTAWKLASLLGEGSAAGYTPLDDLFEEPSSGYEAVTEGDPLLILPTAAVEGVARGAVLTHRNLLTASQVVAGSLQLTQADRHLAALPLFHITGLELSLATHLAAGANVLSQGFDPQAAALQIDQHGVSLLASFPPVLSMLLDARGEGEWDSLRYVLGLDSPEIIQKLLQTTGAEFWTGYGQTETTGVVTLGPVTERPGTAGKPHAAARLRCVDESGAEVEHGQQGEIVVQGPLVFAGYWRDEQATDHVFRDGWHHTGDLGSLDEEGYLSFAGRMLEKDLIKSGGENVYPAEVERVLLELPEVRAACVIGVPDDTWGEAVKAVIELETDQGLTLEEVQKAIANRIADYKKPRRVEFVEDLPRREDGSLDREAIKGKYGN